MMGAAVTGFKASARVEVAHPLVPTGARVLGVLASSTLPLAPGEIVSRSGVPRRTVYYWLRKLLSWGAVERVGKPRAPGVLYTITQTGYRLLERYRTDFERVQRTLQTAMAGCPRACRVGGGGVVSKGGSGGGGGGGIEASLGVSKVGLEAGSGGFGLLSSSSGGGGFALCVLRRGRWVPVLPVDVFVVRGLSGVRLPWWVVVDGGNGFREVGFRLPWRRLRRLLQGFGFRVPKRVKRVVVYCRGKEVHADAATKLGFDVIASAGVNASVHQYAVAFAASCAALLAAGVDGRTLQLMVAALARGVV